MDKFQQLSSVSFAYVYGFSLRKFQILKRFLPHTKLKRIHSLTNLSSGDYVITWGMRELKIRDQTYLNVIRVEDGFLRSIGLGTALNEPISWVFDDRGLYFNTQQPSRLETILNDFKFDDNLLCRADNIRKLLISTRLSKYNLQQISANFPEIKDQQKILVIGQVEGDASLEYGSPYIKTNIELLKTVHGLRPDAYIVYRPHPDVVEGWRKDSINQNHANLYVKEINTTGDIIDWIEWADEVHVMTSLSGFEALIRSKSVHCYGQPFYAGWGLTVDYIQSCREKRKISCEELIAATLILYPCYRSLKDIKAGLIEVEDAIQQLQQLKKDHFRKRWNWTNLLKPFLRH